MKKILKEIEERHSIRNYKNKEVSKEDILTVLEAARLSASGNNTQPWKYIVITDYDRRKEIVKADGNQKWMLTAPVLIACLADPSKRSKELEKAAFFEDSSDFELKRSIRDSSISITSMMYQAQSMGLATCWTGFFSQKEMRKALNISDNYWVSGILTLGYPNETVEVTRRKLEDIFVFEDELS